MECGQTIYSTPRERIEAMQWPQARYHRTDGIWDIRIFVSPNSPPANLSGSNARPRWSESAWTRRGARRKARRLLASFIEYGRPVPPGPSGVVRPADLP